MTNTSTAYKLMKQVITRGGYKKTDTAEKLNTFYAAGRLTKAQLDEHQSLMTAKKK